VIAHTIDTQAIAIAMLCVYMLHFIRFVTGLIFAESGYVAVN
jgi:hypothetical protein